MTSLRSLAVAAVCAATAGCGLGPGESSEGEASLVVTRGYGAERMLEATAADPPESETVIRLLDREAEITTRYGGGFVHSIDGVAGEVAGGRTSDWFFFVNGVESDRGAAEVEVRGGDRIWWDYRDWTDALRTPAVVGSWPEPFVQVSTPEDERLGVSVECLGAGKPCEAVSEALADAGVEPAEPARDPGPRMLVGPWERVRRDPVAAQIDDGPAVSGVFARFEPGRAGYRLIGLSHEAEPAFSADAEAGLVAAVRRGDEPPTWVVSGVDEAGVERAAEAVGDELVDRYALIVSGDRTIAPPLTVVDE